MQDKLGHLLGGKTSIGKPIPRIDVKGKVTGRTSYANDLSLPNVLFGMTLRAAKAPAKILNIDTSRAEKVVGVAKILTAKDVPGHNSHGVLNPDAEVLSTERTVSYTDAIALVAAESLEAAKEALGLIKVEYEPLPGVFDPYEAMKPEAPRVHPKVDNVIYRLKIRKGCIEEGFAKSAAIVENTYKTQLLDHAFLQTEAALAYVDHRGHVVIHVATQYSHWDRLEIARSLSIKASKVQVIVPAVGGAFGGREDMTLQIHACLLALYTGRPVKMEYGRKESFFAHSKRHPVTMKVKTGADKEGYLMAMEAEVVGDSGAYCSWAPNILRKTAVHLSGPYFIPNIKIDSYAVYTNNPFAGAMRGFGAAQSPIAAEAQLDMLAEELGMHPFTIRWRNAFRKGSITATGQELVTSVGLEETMLQAANSFGWDIEKLK